MTGSRIVIIAGLAGVALLPLGWIAMGGPLLSLRAPVDLRASQDSDGWVTATAMAPVPTMLPTEIHAGNNMPDQIPDGAPPHLTRQQIEFYLQANHRDAASLLAGCLSTGDQDLLDEALANYPNDPRVLFTAWCRLAPRPGGPDVPMARRQILDALKRAAPDNALANYLSGANYFTTGRSDLAIDEVRTGTAKPNYNDYTQDTIQSMTEAYEAAGYPEADSKLVAVSGTLLPHLNEMKIVSQGLVDLARSYQQAGDDASALGALEMCQDLGRLLDRPNALCLMQNMIGIAIQRQALEVVLAITPDPAASLDVQNQLEEIFQRRNELGLLLASHSMGHWLQSAPSQEVIRYCDRMRVFGEQKALQWIVNRTAGDRTGGLSRGATEANGW